MLTKDSIYVILFSLPVYQLLFYTIQLITFKKTNPSKKYLGFLLLGMTVFLVINAIHFLEYEWAFSYLYVIYLPVLLSIAPAYFLYILSITRENHDVSNKERMILFSPAILMLAANIIIFGTMDSAERLALISKDVENSGAGFSGLPDLMVGFWIAAIVLIFAQVAFIITRVSKIMLAEADQMRRQPSHLAYLEWRWIIGISVSALLFLVINALFEMALPVKHMGLAIVYNFLMLVSGGLTGLLGMKQDSLLNQVEKMSRASLQNTNGDNHKEDSKGAISGSFMSQAEADEIHKKIMAYLVAEKPYINSGFSMHDLCDKLNLSRRKTSYVLNEVIRKNFYGVVNEFRVKEAEELLLKDDLNLMKIEALGEMVGFQSKSSFNACFKKLTGMTPSEYRMKKRLS